jgi:hypothetical protein
MEEFDQGIYECTRDYTDRTLKLLFGLSGNRCAYPGCKNRLIEHATLFDPEVVVAEVCHIYGIKSTSPRPCPLPFDSRTELQRFLNNFDNLILLCRDHHKIADAQENTYTTVQLFEWKKNHIDKVLKTRVSSISEQKTAIKILFKTFEVKNFDGNVIDIMNLDPEVRGNPFNSSQMVAHRLYRHVIEMDNGQDFPFITEDYVPSVRVGSRLTVLVVSNEANFEAGLIYNHQIGFWEETGRLDPDAIFFKPKKIVTVPVLLGTALLCSLLILASVYLGMLDFPIWIAGILLLVAVSFFAANFLFPIPISWVLKRRLNEVAKNVTFY